MSYGIKALAVVGKTIARVENRITWDTTTKAEDSKDVAAVTLYFTDGTYLYIHATGGAGCNECDPDGSVSKYLDLALNDEIPVRTVVK